MSVALARVFRVGAWAWILLLAGSIVLSWIVMVLEASDVGSGLAIVFGSLNPLTGPSTLAPMVWAVPAVAILLLARRLNASARS